MAEKVAVNQTDFKIQPADSKLTFKNRLDHFIKHLGLFRGRNRITPGLYSMGSPVEDSPVFVTANYTLSFDAVRSALSDVDCYILVLDTRGINVWCAAGKGTFGTDELVSRIEAASLSEVVKHRKLIVPQLGAPGVAAHEVKKRSGFNVEYGPVHVKDLPEYLKSHEATPEMRKVQFPFRDRLILTPVDLIQSLPLMIIIALLVYFIGGKLASLGVIMALVAGTVLFPILLPWLPTPNFSSKGFILGGIVAIPFVLMKFVGNPDVVLWQRTGWALSYMLALPPVTAFTSLNFTGASTFTSRTGVKLEMYKYIPIMAWMLGGGILISVTIQLTRVFGG